MRPWQPTAPLDGPRFKIDRAGVHLKEFDRQFTGYKDANPYGLLVEEDADADVVRWRLDARLAPLEVLPLLAGEVIYHLHSALNHLAYALAKRPNRSAAFPMMERCDPVRFEQMTDSMPPDAIKLINGLQPYQRGDGARTDPLWALAHLRNLDAHRSIFVPESGINIRDQPPGIEIIRPSSGRLDDRAVIAQAPLSLYREQNLEPNIGYSVRIREGSLPTEDAPTTLHRIHDYVRDVAFPVFERFFS